MLNITVVLLSLPLLFAAGFLTQRVGTCAVAAAYEIARQRRANRLLGFLLCAMVSTATMLVVDRLGIPVFGMFHAAAVTQASMAGAVIFAIGAHINGRCSLGTLAEVAQGRAPGLATITGMIAGAFGAATVFPPNSPAMAMMSAASPIEQWPTLPVLAAMLFLVLLLVAVLQHSLSRSPTAGYWSPVGSMIANGVITGLLFVLIRRWPYTNLISDAAHGELADIALRLGLTATLFAGAVVAAVRGGLFTWRQGRLRDWTGAFGAGTLMGFGALLVPGGNEALLFTGVPLLLPGPSAAYAVMIGTLVILTLLRPDRNAKVAQVV